MTHEWVYTSLKITLHSVLLICDYILITISYAIMLYL